jgi:hypothetical protein
MLVLFLVSCAGPRVISLPPAIRSSIATASTLPMTLPIATVTLLSPSGTTVPLRTHASLHRGVVLGLQQRYLEEEGFHHRGPLFARTTGAIDQARSDDSPISEFEVLALLGPPDFGGMSDRGSQYVYVYKSNAREHVIVIDFNPEGLMVKLGYNSKNAFSTEDYPKPQSYPRMK